MCVSFFCINQLKMGTRGYYCIKHRGLYYVFYNHFDSQEIAETIVKEIKTFTDDEFETMRCALNRVRTMEEYKTRWKNANQPVRSTGFDGIFNAACHPEDYELVGLETDLRYDDERWYCSTWKMFEFVVVLDLETKAVVENGVTVYSW